MTDNLKPQRPTMTDIARLANVSQSTVSLVLNEFSGAKVSARTRELVLGIARELGYPVNRRARGATSAAAGRTTARTGRTERDLILYLADELSTSPQGVRAIDGAKDSALENDCLLSIFVTCSNPDTEAKILQATLANPALLGVIYATIFTRAVTLPALLDQVPTVLLNCRTQERSHASVLPAELLGGFGATMHLIEAGHRRIAHISGERWMDAAAERLKGYRQALSSSDIPFDPRLLREGDWMTRTGYEHTLALMALDTPPTAIFCANDLMAMGALDAARELKLELPRQLSIIGYDDEEMTRYTHPPLSTVLLPSYAMGRWAADTLVEQAGAAGVNRSTPQRHPVIKLDCPVVARSSVASVAD